MVAVFASDLARKIPVSTAVLFLLSGFIVGRGALGLLVHYTGRLPWAEAFLVAAVLSPTDFVFASAVVEHAEIPIRLRHLLKVESGLSGLNDGLALRDDTLQPGELVAELLKRGALFVGEGVDAETVKAIREKHPNIKRIFIQAESLGRQGVG